MRALTALAVIVMSLMLGVALTACSSDDSIGQDYYENDTHHGYPGPGIQSPGRDS